MDIQAHKLEFLSEYLRVNDEELLLKLSNLLRRERQKRIKNNLQPMTHEELSAKLTKAENDILEGKVMSQEEIEVFFRNKRIVPVSYTHLEVYKRQKQYFIDNPITNACDGTLVEKYRFDERLSFLDIFL